MKRRRLKVRVDPHHIALSKVVDQESDDLIDGVTNVVWTFDPVGGHGIVVLTFDATMIDFAVIPPHTKE